MRRNSCSPRAPHEKAQAPFSLDSISFAGAQGGAFVMGTDEDVAGKFYEALGELRDEANRCDYTIPADPTETIDVEGITVRVEGASGEESPNPGPCPRLTDPEHALFEELLHDRLGDRVRLEQERVSFASLRRALASLD